MTVLGDAEGLPRPGQFLQMERTTTQAEVGQRIGEGSEGVVHRAYLPGGAAFAVKWYKPASATPEQWAVLQALSRRSSPHPSFIWPLAIVTSRELPGFGYLMPLKEERFVSLADILKRKEQPTFRVMASVALSLVDAFSALHHAGLCYRDINFGNVSADPDQAEIRILDNDHVGTDAAYTAIGGTLRFMAPEILRGEARPSASTDLYSLAVLLFLWFIHGHPLDGRRVESTQTWDGQRHQSTTALTLLHYGKDPLFVFHPTNPSNRPVEGDPMWVWWGIYPKLLRDLFMIAFTDGLTDPSPQVRVTEGRWRMALLRVRDSVSACSNCSAAVFYDREAPTTICWRCETVPAPPPVLEVRGARLVLTEGATLTNHHLLHDRDHRGEAGVVAAHPMGRGVTLRNQTDTPWTIRLENGESAIVEPGRRAAVRPMEINFGPAEGRIKMG